MASPRRSNRGGHARSKKKDDDDDGGTTRCVCNEQHHEGVMIQCETCKVWQHCPCVGLGNGEVTPDKYYCETCRPQNHPYKVQNGVLITNNSGSKRGHAAPAVPPPSLKSKPTKKRNTMNSKEASTPMDLIIAQQKWSEGDPLDAIESNTHSNRASKRRRKTESATDEEDDGSKADDDGVTTESDYHHRHQHHHTDSQNNRGVSGATSSTSPSTPPKATSNGHFKRATSPKHKKSSSSSNKSVAAQSRSSSPSTPNGSSLADTHSHTDLKADDSTSSPKNARTATDVVSNGQDADSVVPLAKRRKTKSEAAGRGDTVADDAMSDTPSENVKMENGNDSTDVPTSSRSRKNGFSRTGSNRRIQVGSDVENNDDASSPTDSQAGQTGSPGSSSTATGTGRRTGGAHHLGNGGKKSTRRAAEPRGSARHNGNNGNSRHSTPQPNDRSGTPQPLPPVTPAVVRYPSSKMTMQEMTKRAKQLLDYITRMQVDMANEKNRSGCSSPASTPPKNGIMSSSSTMTVAAAAVMVPTAPVSVPHPVQHHAGDGQVPDLTRTSMESNVDSQIGDAEVKGGDMTSKTTMVNNSCNRNGGELADSKSPVGTSSPPPAAGTGAPGDNNNNNNSSTPSADVKAEELPRDKWTSFELMDKLTGDLIRFQERFGAHT